MIPSFGGFPKDSWPSIHELLDKDPSDQYLWSVFMATSHMLVIGFGGRSPRSTSDMWTTIYSMGVGAMTFALIISEITSLIRSMEHSTYDYKEKLTRVKVCLEWAPLGMSSG